MDRRSTLRTRSYRGDAVMTRLSRKPRTMLSSTRYWLFRNWRSMAVVTATSVTLMYAMATRISGADDWKSILAADGTPYKSMLTDMPNVVSFRPMERWHRRLMAHATRLLTSESDEDYAPIVAYETQLELFLCNPSLETENNDAYLVEVPEFTRAITHVQGLEQVDTREVTVTLKTAPTDDLDVTYKCDETGMLQWRVQIKYRAEAATVLDTTPAITAARASDYVTYSTAEFKSLLTAYINDEYKNGGVAVDLSASDVTVPVVGWIVTFPGESSTIQNAGAEGQSGWIGSVIEGEYWLWGWWIWIFYGTLLACCLLPLCYVCNRRRKIGVSDKCVGNKSREASPVKSYGAEWGIREPDLDLEYNYRNTNTPGMKIENSHVDGRTKSASFFSRSSSNSPNSSVRKEKVGRTMWPLSTSTTSSKRTPVQASPSFDTDDGSVAHTRVMHPRDDNMGVSPTRKATKGTSETKS